MKAIRRVRTKIATRLLAWVRKANASMTKDVITKGGAIPPRSSVAADIVRSEDARDRLWELCVVITLDEVVVYTRETRVEDAVAAAAAGDTENDVVHRACADHGTCKRWTDGKQKVRFVHITDAQPSRRDNDKAFN